MPFDISRLSFAQAVHDLLLDVLTRTRSHTHHQRLESFSTAAAGARALLEVDLVDVAGLAEG
jgi:hypothetical protein